MHFVVHEVDGKIRLMKRRMKRALIIALMHLQFAHDLLAVDHPPKNNLLNPKLLVKNNTAPPMMISGIIRTSLNHDR